MRLKCLLRLLEMFTKTLRLEEHTFSNFQFYFQGAILLITENLSIAKENALREWTQRKILH